VNAQGFREIAKLVDGWRLQAALKACPQTADPQSMKAATSKFELLFRCTLPATGEGDLRQLALIEGREGQI